MFSSSLVITGYLYLLLSGLMFPRSTWSSLGVSSPSLVASMSPLSSRSGLGVSSPSPVALMSPQSSRSSLGVSPPPWLP